MSMPPIMRVARNSNARSRRSSNAASIALAAAGLLLLLAGRASAQQDDSEGANNAIASILSTDELDPGAPRPLAFKPLVAKPLTPADLPPSSPLSGGSLPRTASAAFGPDWRAGRNEYRAIIERESLAQGVPPALVDAVMAVESRYNPAVVGMDGEIGLMQLMLPTARMLGFTGTTEQLALPDVNIHYGAKYLAGAWRLAGGDLCTATMKYRAGHGETRFSFLSVDYCIRVRSHLAAQGVAVNGSVPQPVFGRPSLGSQNLGSQSPGSQNLGSQRVGNQSAARTRSRQLSGGAAVNFAALNTHLRALTETLHGPR
jgi:soluble lytic murein transglycosylase-like protein